MIILKAIFLITFFITGVAAVSFTCSLNPKTRPNMKYGYWYAASLVAMLVSGILLVVLR